MQKGREIGVNYLSDDRILFATPVPAAPRSPRMSWSFGKARFAKGFNVVLSDLRGKWHSGGVRAASASSVATVELTVEIDQLRDFGVGSSLRHVTMINVFEEATDE